MRGMYYIPERTKFDIIPWCFVGACGARGFLELTLPAVARFLCALILLWCSQLTIAYVCYSNNSFPVFSSLLHQGTSVGADCDRNADVSGLAFTDNALCVSARSPADITVVKANSRDMIHV